jgi:hypothetical protein
MCVLHSKQNQRSEAATCLNTRHQPSETTKGVHNLQIQLSTNTPPSWEKAPLPDMISGFGASSKAAKASSRLPGYKKQHDKKPAFQPSLIQPAFPTEKQHDERESRARRSASLPSWGASTSTSSARSDPSSTMEVACARNHPRMGKTTPR